MNLISMSTHITCCRVTEVKDYVYKNYLKKHANQQSKERKGSECSQRKDNLDTNGPKDGVAPLPRIICLPSRSLYFSVYPCGSACVRVLRILSRLVR